MTEPDPPRPIRTAPPGQRPEKGWADSIKDWAFQLTVLKVVTYVGDAEIELTDDGAPKSIKVRPDGKALVTVCDLIGGDVTNTIPAEYVDNEGLRGFHSQQVAAAAAVLPNNLKVLGDLVSTVLK